MTRAQTEIDAIVPVVVGSNDKIDATIWKVFQLHVHHLHSFNAASVEDVVCLLHTVSLNEIVNLASVGLC